MKEIKKLKEVNPEDDEIFNQDNNSVWINPIVQKKAFKLFYFFIFLFLIFYIINCFVKEPVNYIEKIILSKNVILFFISIIVFLLRRLITNRKIKNAENEILKISDLKYYRDILDENSAGVLSYCYNKKINYEDIIVATILIFQRNGIFQIDNTKKAIMLSSDNKTILNESESYFYKKIKERGNIIYFRDLKEIIANEMFKGNFINLIKKDSKENRYFETKKSEKKIFIIIMLIYLIIFLPADVFLAEFGLIGVKTVIISVLFVFLLLYFDYIEKKNNYIRTFDGIKLTAKLEGLKNFIKDFSNIEDRNIKEILLWDYYMIYAIIFNLKGNLDKEIKELYKLFSK